jgi:putative oxidoreductase
MMTNSQQGGSASGLLDRVASLLAALERLPLAVFQTLFRLCIAAVFWHSGMVKLASWQATLALFRYEYKIPLIPPEIAATLAAAVELTCPVLLVLGLAARLATLPMLAMTCVIQFLVYPEDWLQHLTWAAMLLFILSRGPGPLSLDHIIATKLLARYRG